MSISVDRSDDGASYDLFDEPLTGEDVRAPGEANSCASDGSHAGPVDSRREKRRG